MIVDPSAIFRNLTTRDSARLETLPRDQGIYALHDHTGAIRYGPYDPFARLCASRPLVFLGEISYSVYLLQWFVWIGWKHVIARLPVFSGHPYLMISCAAASLIVVSIGSYYAFEKPARSLLRRRLDPFASRAPQSVAA